MYNQMTGTPQKFSHALGSFLELEPGFKESLKTVYEKRRAFEREQIIGLVEALNNTSYCILYEEMQKVGFAPNLLSMTRQCPKEKARIAMFLIRILQLIEPQIYSLLEIAQAPQLTTAKKTNNKILVAEDDPITAEILLHLLKSWQYEPVLAGNGDIAWSVLQARDAPRFAILDWMMPGLSGIEICQKMRRQREMDYSYVMMLTSRNERQDIVQGLEAGADDYIVKPFDESELRARIIAGKRILEMQSNQA